MSRRILSDRWQRAIRYCIALSILAAVLAALYGSRWVEPEPTGYDSYSRGPLGHRAFVEILEALDTTVERARDQRHDLESTPVMIIEPERRVLIGSRKLRLEEVVHERYRIGAPTIVVVPKWDPLPEGWEGEVYPAGDGWLAAVRDAGPIQKIPIHRAIEASSRQPTSFAALDSVELDVPRPQVFRPKPGSDLEIAVGTPEAAFVVVVRSGSQGPLYLVSDPDLLHNFNVQRGDHALLWNTLIREELHSDRIVVNEVFHGHGEPPSLWRRLGEFPAVLLVVHGLFVALALVIVGTRRFGPPRESAPSTFGGPKALIRIASGVLVAGRRCGRLAAAYAEREIVVLAAELGCPEVEPRACAAWLDRVAQRRGLVSNADRIVERAESMSARRRTNTSAALRLAHSAWAFRREFRRLRATERGKQ